MDLMKSAEILIDKIEQDYKDDIAVVVVMGSYIYNETHSRSDLDMYFVPKTERGKNLGTVFIIDGIGFDFWPITWERLERIAGHEERITSIVTEGRVIYSGSEEDLERFNQLKSKALDVEDRSKFIRKSKQQFQKTYEAYFKLLQAKTLSGARKHAMEIIFSLTYATALLNGTTVKRGRGKLKKEILNMNLVPKDFSVLYDTVFISQDIKEIQNNYRQLMINMEELLQEEEKKEQKPLSFRDQVDEYYEELINFYNKIHHACEVGDKYTPLFAAVEITKEIEAAFSGTGVSSEILPDIIGAYDPEDTEIFIQTVIEHQSRLFKLLQNKGVRIRVFDDFIGLKEYMNSL